MKKSLQDQLLGAGLIDTKKAKKIAKENRKANKEKVRSKDSTPSETQLAIRQAQQEKLERDRELNLQLKRESDKKALTAQVNQLIDHYKLKRKPGELAYNFKDGNKIKKINVTPEMLEEIVRGRLCIARHTGRAGAGGSVGTAGESYEIIPKPIADKIRERDEAAIVVYNSKVNMEEKPPAEADEDYYAQFEIPDDLTW